MKTTFAAVPVPVIPAPRGTDAAREAIGLAYSVHSKEGPLFPVHGGFIGWGRQTKYSVISEAGDVRSLGIDYPNIPGFGLGLASCISPDRKRLLVVEGAELAVLTFETGTREPLGVSATAAAWLDDDRIAVSDGKKLAVRRLSTADALGERALGEAPVMGARVDGVIVIVYGDEPKKRAIEVYRLEGTEIVAIGKRTKVPFSIVVPFEKELYLVETAVFGNWVACFRVEVKEEAEAKDGKKAKKKEDATPGDAGSAKPWAGRRVASVSIGKTRDDAKLEEALATFAPKVRTKYKLDQLLDCTVDDRGQVGFTIDAGGESKASAASILELLALPEVKALPHLSLAMDGRPPLAQTIVKELSEGSGDRATVTGIDVSGAQKGEAFARLLLGGALAPKLERVAMRDLGLWDAPFAGLDALETLDLETNPVRVLPPSLPSLRRLRLHGAKYADLAASLPALLTSQLVELRLSAPENHYSMLPAAAIAALSARGLGVLRELSLSGQPEASDAAVIAIAGAAPRLEVVLLARTAVGPAGVEALVKGCPSLTNLDVAGNAEPANGLGAGGSSLERLRLTLDDDGAELLAKNQDLGAVKRLLLLHGKLGPKGIRALVGSCLFAGLAELTIDGIPLGSWEQLSEPDHIGEAGTVLLAGARSFASLTHLRLRCATLGDEGASALASSPSLSKLATLDLDHNKISPAAIVLLLEKLPALKKLTCQLRDKSGLEKVREAAFRRGIELALFHGLYKL